MDGMECVEKDVSNIGVEDGELEDGELDDTADDTTNLQASNHLQVHEVNVNLSPNIQDRKKKSKKRKREEADKAHHINDGEKSPIDCEKFPYHNAWDGGNQNVTQRALYDSPSGSECGGDNPSGFGAGKQRTHQNDDGGHRAPQRMKRHADKRKDHHRGQKVKRSQGINSNYFEDGYNNPNNKTEVMGYKSDMSKSFRSKKKFNAADKHTTCKYFLEGKCFKGAECSFSHCTERKPDLCPLFLVGTCRKNSCQFYHGDWPCKDFHVKGDCQDGDFCKFSHKDLTEETQKLLYTGGNMDDSEARRSTTEDLQKPSLDNRKKIPSLLDIKIFPPVPSPHGSNFRGRPSRGNKFSRGKKKGGQSNMSFDGRNFGMMDDQRSHENNFMKQKQGWGRKPYDMDWCGMNELGDVVGKGGEVGYHDQQFNEERNFNDHFENNIENSPSIKNQSFNHMVNRTNLQDLADFNVKAQIQTDEIQMSNYNEASDNQISNNCLRSADVRHSQSNVFQNNIQLPNVLGMTHPILRLPPQTIQPMQNNILRSANRPVNPTTCSQLGILGAAPIQMPHGLPPHNPSLHLNLPQPGIHSTQPIINQFVPPPQPLVGLLGRNPRAMFQPNLSTINSQPFLQLPPFPPPRFDFNQIIRNIVRNTLSTQFMVKPPSPISVPIVIEPQVSQSIDVGDAGVIQNSISDNHNTNVITTVTTGNNNNNNNNNTLAAKPGMDPRLKSKDEKPEITEENGHSQPFKKDENVPEINGTARKMEYCLRPLVLVNSRPSIPTHVLMNFKDGLFTSDDPRLKKYFTSLSDFKLDDRKTIHDPRSHRKREIKTPDHKMLGFSSPSLLSPTDSTNKPYTLPDIFIPPTSAPNIELEEKALSGSSRIKLRKNSSPIFSPTRDFTKLLLNPYDIQCSGAAQNPLGSPSSDNKKTEKVQKRIIDYRNDPRFKKKKMAVVKSEDKSVDPESNVMDDVSSSVSSVGMEFTKQSIINKSSASRIPSPIPTFPRYCTSYISTGLFMSSSAEELEDVENESLEIKEVNSTTEFDADDVIPSSQSPAPFYPECENPPEMMEGINLKDIFKTIDPTTSPFC